MRIRVPAVVSALLVAAALTPVAGGGAARAVGTVPAPERRGIVLWGDSLTVESKPSFVFFGQLAGIGPVSVHGYGGSAPCDWRADVARTLIVSPPRLAVLSFVGNSITPCMVRDGTALTGAALLERYRRDLGALLDRFAAAHVAVLLVGQPPSATDPSFAARRDWMYHQLAAKRAGVRYVDAGDAVAGDDGSWVATLPCVSFEGRDRGCSHGRIPVRAPDRGHFCPAPDPRNPLRCPVWSSGAARFALGMLDGALAIVRPA